MKSKLSFILLSAVLLSACQPTMPEVRSYGNDALPSAEVIAFRAADARLKYRDARIEFDANECPVYQGIAPDGTVKRELLRTEAGVPLCSRR